MTESQPDTVLVERATAGDGDSFTELCRRYYPAMVAVGHAVLGDRHLAEDAAQQAFAKAAVNLPRLQKAERFGSWVAAICRNEARDVARASRGFRTQEVLPEVEAPSAPDDRGEVVKEALKRLPPPAREVIFLKYYDGLSYERISATLGISGQAINGRLRRAKSQLAEYLRQEGFGEVKS